MSKNNDKLNLKCYVLALSDFERLIEKLKRHKFFFDDRNQGYCKPFNTIYHAGVFDRIEFFYIPNSIFFSTAERFQDIMLTGTKRVLVPYGLNLSNGLEFKVVCGNISDDKDDIDHTFTTAALTAAEIEEVMKILNANVNAK